LSTILNKDADKKVILQCYSSLVRFKLDYRCIFYGPARKSYFQTLDAIHNQVIRICLAFPTSHIKSLSVEENEPQLKNRYKIKSSIRSDILLKVYWHSISKQFQQGKKCVRGLEQCVFCINYQDGYIVSKMD
jgi:hypothetical protein